jgi:NADH-quinone oxidoreductase subunit N
MLIALAAIPSLYSAGNPPLGSGGVDAIVFYLIAYGAMTVGAFTLLSYLSHSDHPVENVDDLAGLGSTHPALGILMTVFLLSLTGIPLTAGFFGKFVIFLSALAVPGSETMTDLANQARLFRILAVIGVLNAALGAWYYMRVVAVMYLRPGVRPLPKVVSWPGIAALVICVVVTLGAPWVLWSPAHELVPATNRETPAAAHVSVIGE